MVKLILPPSDWFKSVMAGVWIWASFVLGLLLSIESANVKSLKESDFDAEILNSGKNAFVKFFAPWCQCRLDKTFLFFSCDNTLLFTTYCLNSELQCVAGVGIARQWLKIGSHWDSSLKTRRLC